MKKIYEALLAGRYPNSCSLALELEVSAQTTKRDLEFMRDRWNLPIVYDPIRHGYYLRQQIGQSPRPSVAPAQAFALLLLG
ncbi:MAG TPA: hypothetical protein VL361_01580 [Candidatus Limnocylindrales bacterium]|jgi:predicted DNA-binding transcriptional regulator YafY|nr:hypothetical protein [Candidatus Limnocylindrales bacterium]